MHEDNWESVAEAIMTTDTKPKGISKKITLNGGESITITGIAKGAGMLQPNMAPMLAFRATDISVDQDDLDKLLIYSFVLLYFVEIKKGVSCVFGFKQGSICKCITIICL